MTFGRWRPAVAVGRAVNRMSHGGHPGTAVRMAGIELRSAAFNDHAYIPDRFAKLGENVSPPLSWSGVPDGTAELLLLCEDPDAPTGTFLHWLVTGVDPGSTGAESGETPGAARS